MLRGLVKEGGRSMAAAEIIAKVKTDLRISHTALDTDLSDIIDACAADLRIVGVQVAEPPDKTILAAIKLYCRAAYTDDTDKAEAYMARYNAMKATLMMAEGYGGAKDE